MPKKFVVLFEIYGKKFKATPEADNVEEAIAKVKSQFQVLEVREEKEIFAPADDSASTKIRDLGMDDIFKSFNDIFGGEANFNRNMGRK